MNTNNENDTKIMYNIYVCNSSPHYEKKDVCNKAFFFRINQMHN